jgi:cytochrome c-type biogenesis protein CcmE
VSRRKLVVVLIALAAFAVFGITAFRSALTPYVTFAEAAAVGGSAQVSGTVDKASARFDSASGLFYFDLTDTSGTTMTVQYEGAPPVNFDDAESVVAVGSVAGNTFVAKKILVKCPSKYHAE